MFATIYPKMVFKILYLIGIGINGKMIKPSIYDPLKKITIYEK